MLENHDVSKMEDVHILHFLFFYYEIINWSAPMHWHKTIHNELPQPPTPSQEEISPQKVLVST